MLKYLRDPIWQFFGFVATVALGLAAIALANPTLVEHWWQPALIGTPVLIVLVAALCFRRARQARPDAVWDERLEDLRRIEEKAQLLTDRLSGYTSLETHDPTSQQLYRELENEKGLFRRHKDLWGAINDFLNRAGIVMADWQAWDSRGERDEAVRDMLDHHNRLLEQIDKVRKGYLD